jgi:hypothetical protein
MIPPAVLRQLYAQESLTNTPEGTTFRLKNSLAPATVIAVDRQKVPPEKIFVSWRAEKSASELAATNQKFDVRDEVTILLAGTTLSPGAHKLEIKAKTKEWAS